jgi:hypothetical protein
MIALLAQHLVPPRRAASGAPAGRPAGASVRRVEEPYMPQEYVGGGGWTRGGLRRVCFTLQFDTPELGAYLKAHEAV